MKGFVKEQYAAKVRKQLEVLKADVKKLREQLTLKRTAHVSTHPAAH